MANVISELVKNVPLPRMFKVRQIFDRPRVVPVEIPSILSKKLEQPVFVNQIKPGMNIAITAGSRQIANLPAITKTIVDFVKRQGANPFIIASMGSHGGATSEGQREILAREGITEESMQCPIKTNMEVVKIGVNADGLDVYIGKDAAEADGIIINCRVKPHTCFTGPYESGIMKMMTIGLGKQKGANTCHEAGFGKMAHNIPTFGRAILKYAPILFAVAVIENSYDETAEINVFDHSEIDEKEPPLLAKARNLLPKIWVPECDVLVVDQIGKNYSGGGMDPNVTGTFVTPYAHGGIKSQRVAILDLSERSYHSGTGMGSAHVCTKRFIDKVDLEQTYPNLITSTVLENARIPVIMKNDKEAIQVCVKTCTGIDKEHVRIVRIQNTLNIEHILLSEAYFEEVKYNPHLIIESEPEPMQFDADGALVNLNHIY